MSHVSRLTHSGKSILLIDLSNLKPGQFTPVFEEATRQLSLEPLGTARVVTDVTESRFDPRTLVELERFIRAVTPHCAANAVVGVTGIKLVAWIGMRSAYKCPSELCATVDAGKNWVVGFGA